MITELGLDEVIILILRASLATTICFKSRVILKSWPKVRVCLLSNSCSMISSKTKKNLVVPIFPINLITLVFFKELIISLTLVDLAKLVALVDLVEPVKLVGLVGPKN